MPRRFANLFEARGALPVFHVPAGRARDATGAVIPFENEADESEAARVASKQIGS